MIIKTYNFIELKIIANNYSSQWKLTHKTHLTLIDFQFFFHERKICGVASRPNEHRKMLLKLNHEFVDFAQHK